MQDHKLQTTDRSMPGAFRRALADFVIRWLDYADDDVLIHELRNLSDAIDRDELRSVADAQG